LKPAGPDPHPLLKPHRFLVGGRLQRKYKF
jgi:hypothetical protein